MEISEKVAYLKGLAEGLNLDTDSKEGKLIAAIIDVLDEMSIRFEDIDETVLEDGEVVCPNCGAKLEFDLSDLAAAAEDGEDEE